MTDTSHTDHILIVGSLALAVAPTTFGMPSAASGGPDRPEKTLRIDGTPGNRAVRRTLVDRRSGSIS